MIIANVQVDGTTAKVSELAKIPKGIIGAKIGLTFTDDLWNDLIITAVFRSSITKDVVDVSDTVTIPPEVVSTPDQYLYLGLYGVSEDGTTAIPTFWAKLGMVHDATDPSNDETTDTTLPMWAQLERRVDVLLESGMAKLVDESVASIKQDAIGEILNMYPAAEEATF